MVMATSALAVVIVPLFAKLLVRFSPARVVSTGFLVSAVARVVEWRLSTRDPWVVVFLYLHLGAFAAILLSGFWSIVGERFDPRGARRAFGRISAAGTVGGVLGSIAAERAAVSLPADAILLLLASRSTYTSAGSVRWSRRGPSICCTRSAIRLARRTAGA